MLLARGCHSREILGSAAGTEASHSPGEPRRRHVQLTVPAEKQRAEHSANLRTTAGGLPGRNSANSAQRRCSCPRLPGREVLHHH